MRLVELSLSRAEGTAYIDLDRVEVMIPHGANHTKIIMQSGFDIVVDDDIDELAERIEPYDAERHG